MKMGKCKKSLLAAIIAAAFLVQSSGGSVLAEMGNEAQPAKVEQTIPDESQEQAENPEENTQEGEKSEADTLSADESSQEEGENSEADEKAEEGGFMEEDTQLPEDIITETADTEFVSDEESFSDLAEDFFEDTLEETDAGISLYATPQNFVQEGSPVKSGAGGFIPVTIGDRSYSSKYVKLGHNEDTQVIPWNNAGNNVIVGRRTEGSGAGTYFVPQNASAKGKFGFRVTNAGYNQKENVKLDMLFTCTNYSDYTYDYKGNKVDDIYPMIGIGEGKEFWIIFKPNLSDVELKVDIVKSGTSTPVAGNYRFRWLDIDMYQRFGFKIQNGIVGNKYATRNSVVNVVTKNIFSKSYEVLTAPAEEIKGEVPENTVVYELDNSSGFYLAILPSGYDGYSTSGKSSIKSTYEEVKAGATQYSTGLNWDAKAYGPIEYPTLSKKVGNDLKAQGTSNVLPSSTAAFYYTLQTEVPEEYPAYYYNEFLVTDALPQGVDYNNYAAVKNMSSGADVSSWFSITSQGDTVKFQATAAALTNADFYGKAYEFQIGVKMDPTEIAPVYSGDNYSYEIKNKASLLCRHQNMAEDTSWTNEVKTAYTGKKNHVQPVGVKKYTAAAGSDSWKESLVVPEGDNGYRYKLSVDVPMNEFGGYMESFEITDTLPDGVHLVKDSVEIYGAYPARAEQDFQVLAGDKNLSIKAVPQALANASFYNKHYDVFFSATVNTAEISPSYNGTTATYGIQNSFLLTTKQKGDGQTERISSNTVTDKIEVPRKDPGVPQKWIVSEDGLVVQKEYEGRDVQALFEIQQKIPAAAKEWKIKKISIKDELADCLELQSARVFCQDRELAAFQNTPDSQNGWKLELSGRQITISSDGELLESLYGQELKIRLEVSLKKDCNLDGYYKANQTPEILEAHIYNTAETEIQWEQGTPDSVKKTSEPTELILREGVPKGRIAVKKTNQNGESLGDAVFQIITAEDIYSAAGMELMKAGAIADTIVTDENGTATSKELYVGKYIVKEVKPPAGYVIDPEGKNVEIKRKVTGGTLEQATFSDEETLVKVRKVSQTEDDETKKTGIPETKFLLWKDGEGKENAKEYVTDEDGWIQIKGLCPGTYFLQEIEVPAGYVPDFTEHRFVMEENGLVQQEQGHVIEVENAYTKAEFLKTDKATGKAVAGATLQLADTSGNVMDTWISEEKPHRINRLPEGEYILTELEAPEGYKKGKPVTCEIKSEAKTQNFLITDVKLVTVTVEKVLHREEIVWAQGNPVFTFCLKGTDLDGESNTFYDTVEFTREEENEQGDIKKNIIFTVPAGEYVATEEKTIRYVLEKIDNVVNGVTGEQSVRFQLGNNLDGRAAFTNKKITDKELTDTDFVRNTVISR